MDTPRNRFTVTPFLLAFLTALVHLPATLVVKVNAFGMGFEHEQPWRLTTNGLTAPLALAGDILTRLRDRLERLSRHALFRPAVAAGACLLVSIIDQQALLTMPLIIGATLSEGQHAGEFMLEERAMGGVGRPSRENITVLSGQVLKAGAVIGRVSKGVGRVSTPVVVGTGNGTVTQVFPGPDVQVGNYVVTNTAVVANGGVFSVVNPSGKALPILTMTPGAGGTTVYASREINFSIVDGSTDFALADAFTFVVSTTVPAVIGTGNGLISGLSLGPDALPGLYRVENIAVVTNGGEWKVVNPVGEMVATGFIVAGAGGTLVLANQRELNLTITDGSTDFALADAFNVAVFNNLGGGKVVAWDPVTFDGRDDATGVLFDSVDATAGDLVGVIIARDATVIKSALEWAAAITAAQKESAYRDLETRGIVAR